MWVLPVAAIFVLGVWLVPVKSSDRPAPPASDAATAGAVGTTGRNVMTQKRPAAAAAYDVDPHPSVIREIETITGTNDAMALVGRRVDLHVDVQERANDVAFWVGPRDNRVLVVLARPNRTGHQRQRGEFAGHRIAPVRDGQRAAVSGVIRPMPPADEMVGWRLADDDKAELDDRKVYIRADAVGSEGHGHF
jgi:hypothetical protein